MSQNPVYRRRKIYDQRTMSMVEEVVQVGTVEVPKSPDVVAEDIATPVPVVETVSTKVKKAIKGVGKGRAKTPSKKKPKA